MSTYLNFIYAQDIEEDKLASKRKRRQAQKTKSIKGELTNRTPAPQTLRVEDAVRKREGVGLMRAGVRDSVRRGAPTAASNPAAAQQLQLEAQQAAAREAQRAALFKKVPVRGAMTPPPIDMGGVPSVKPAAKMLLAKNNAWLRLAGRMKGAGKPAMIGAGTLAAGAVAVPTFRNLFRREVEPVLVEPQGHSYLPAGIGAGIGAGLGAGIGYGLGGGYGALAGAGIGALGGGAAGHYGYPVAADYMANRRLSAEDVVAAYYGDYPYFDKHAFSAGTVDLFPALGGAFYGSLLGTLGGAVASTPRNRRHNLRRNMLLGAGLGAVGGGLAGHYVIPRFLTDSVAAPLRRSSYAEHAGEGALAGGALGGVYGGLVGGPAGAAAGASLLAGTTAGLNTVEKALADNTLIRRYHGVDINDPNWHRPVNRDIQRFYST